MQWATLYKLYPHLTLVITQTVFPENASSSGSVGRHFELKCIQHSAAVQWVPIRPGGTKVGTWLHNGHNLSPQCLSNPDKKRFTMKPRLQWSRKMHWFFSDLLNSCRYLSKSVKIWLSMTRTIRIFQGFFFILKYQFRRTSILETLFFIKWCPILMLFKSVPTGLNTYRLTCSRSKVRVVNKGIEVNVNLTTYLLPTFSNSFYSKFLFALTFLYQYINQLMEINVKKELLHC